MSKKFGVHVIYRKIRYLYNVKERYGNNANIFVSFSVITRRYVKKELRHVISTLIHYARNTVLKSPRATNTATAWNFVVILVWDIFNVYVTCTYAFKDQDYL